MNKMTDFLKCKCEDAGFCQLYNKKMDDAGINWCKNTTKEKRENYHTINKRESKIVTETNTRTLEDTSRLCIAVVGHSHKQFATIENRDYLKPLYLQNLELGEFSKFQNNSTAEIRAFLSDIFEYDKYDYVGTTTASWHMKYTDERRRLDNIDRWIELDKLDDERTLYCATTATTEGWIQDENSTMNFLGIPKRHQEIILNYHKSIGLEPSNRLVPNHNQIICHKNLYKKIENHFRENIFQLSDMVDIFETSDYQEFAKPRVLAFICEFSGMMFLDSLNLNFISVQSRHQLDWFHGENINSRNRGLYNGN